ncbi:hypothetical protein [Nitrosomonas sp.]|uniref:hypothetical protein n=1 Tax=Nitrosomonas sp. TaxID=42353 RepID=UPI0025D49F6C|nr:hypothetical protein [Nitrosomonas sp.]MBV6448331.1 hypothetical protein [Nitrosomonas sp.]
MASASFRWSISISSKNSVRSILLGYAGSLFTALSYKEIPEFMQQLRNQPGIGATALDLQF